MLRCVSCKPSSCHCSKALPPIHPLHRSAATLAHPPYHQPTHLTTKPTTHHISNPTTHRTTLAQPRVINDAVELSLAPGTTPPSDPHVILLNLPPLLPCAAPAIPDKSDAERTDGATALGAGPSGASANLGAGGLLMGIM